MIRHLGVLLVAAGLVAGCANQDNLDLSANTSSARDQWGLMCTSSGKRSQENCGIELVKTDAASNAWLKAYAGNKGTNVFTMAFVMPLEVEGGSTLTLSSDGGFVGVVPIGRCTDKECYVMVSFTKSQRALLFASKQLAVQYRHKRAGDKTFLLSVDDLNVGFKQFAQLPMR